jgi:hypothetical protein
MLDTVVRREREVDYIGCGTNKSFLAYTSLLIGLDIRIKDTPKSGWILNNYIDFYHSKILVCNEANDYTFIK